MQNCGAKLQFSRCLRSHWLKRQLAWGSVARLKLTAWKCAIQNHVWVITLSSFFFFAQNSSFLDGFNCERDANLSDDQRCKCRYNLIVVDNTHRFACFIRGPTVIALYKHRGHLKITVIVSAVLHSLTRYTLLITANLSKSSQLALAKTLSFTWWDSYKGALMVSLLKCSVSEFDLWLKTNPRWTHPNHSALTGERTVLTKQEHHTAGIVQ